MAGIGFPQGTFPSQTIGAPILDGATATVAAAPGLTAVPNLHVNVVNPVIARAPAVHALDVGGGGPRIIAVPDIGGDVEVIDPVSVGDGAGVIALPAVASNLGGDVAGIGTAPVAAPILGAGDAEIFDVAAAAAPDNAEDGAQMLAGQLARSGVEEVAAAPRLGGAAGMMFDVPAVVLGFGDGAQRVADAPAAGAPDFRDDVVAEIFDVAAAAPDNAEDGAQMLAGQLARSGVEEVAAAPRLGGDAGMMFDVPAVVLGFGDGAQRVADAPAAGAPDFRDHVVAPNDTVVPTADENRGGGPGVVAGSCASPNLGDGNGVNDIPHAEAANPGHGAGMNPVAPPNDVVRNLIPAPNPGDGARIDPAPGVAGMNPGPAAAPNPGGGARAQGRFDLPAGLQGPPLLRSQFPFPFF